MVMVEKVTHHSIKIIYYKMFHLFLKAKKLLGDYHLIQSGRKEYKHLKSSNTLIASGLGDNKSWSRKI